jgi:hypothetical protein
MNRLIALAFFVLSVLALVATVTVPPLLNSWDRRDAEFDRVTREMLKEDFRLARLAREARARGDDEEAERLWAERRHSEERLRERIQELAGK